MSGASFNGRLYQRMVHAITSYKNKEISLRQLIRNLEGLHLLLEDPEEKWRVNFYDLWPLLEEVYAVAIDSDNGVLDHDDELVIAGTLEKLTAAIHEEINSSLSGPA